MILATPQTSSAAPPANNSSSSSNSANMGLDPNDFITLLIAQLKNQDPTNPMDPTQFVSQLVQFNSLEQLISINQDLQPATGTGTGTGTGSGGTGSGGTGSGGANGGSVAAAGGTNSSGSANPLSTIL